MEVFLEQLGILRSQFDALSSDHQEDALVAVAEAVGAMRDASVRRRFEKEIELTLAWEAEKMIVEKFAGDWSSTSFFSEPSTSSFDVDSAPSFLDNSVGERESDFVMAELTGAGATCIEDEHKSLSVALERSESLPHNAVGTKCYLIDETNRCDSSGIYQHDEETTPKNAHVRKNTQAVLAGVRNELDGKDRLVCATCGFLANNRKALYRHGLKTHHLLRKSTSSGSLLCKLCSFRTNKMFNYNRHMKRFHLIEER